MPRDSFRIVGTTQAGSFHVERVVAEGGFSVVYRALHGAFRAPVALKCLKVPDDLSTAQRDAYLERFREEAELLFRLSARIPEVVRPLHVDVLSLRDGRFVPFLALEWLEGQSLSDMIAARQASGAAPMGLVKLVKLLAPVARALARAHRFPSSNGRIAIVHCDMKPENVFIRRVDGREEAKLLDYGIAMAMRSAGRKATGPAKPGEFVEPAFFTPGYAAPEQWVPKRFGPTGPKTDVWGLALTLVEAITGTGPLGEESEAKMKATALDESRRPTPRALGAVVSDEIEAAFVQALAVQPAARTADVPTFWASLESALGLAPTFVKKDDRQDPDEPASWVSSPRWNESANPVARGGESPAPPLGKASAPPRPKAPPAPQSDSALVASSAKLALEEPFGEGDAPKPAKPGRAAAVDEDLEMDLPTASSRVGSEASLDVAASPVLAPSSPPSSDELELEPAPPPSKRSAPRSTPPAAAAASLGPARASFGSDSGARVALEIGAGALERRGRASPPMAPAHVFTPRSIPPEQDSHPRSLRGPVQVMGAGAAIALIFVVGAQFVEPIHALGQAPKLVGVGVFVVGLLLLFWRMLDR
jgi:serine/threonine protein kinase